MAGFTLKFVLAVFLVSFYAYGEVLFADDFSDGNDDGWTHLGAAEFQVFSQEYFIYSQGDRGQGTSLNGDQSGSMSTADYSVLCSITMETGNTAGLVCRYIDASQWYYRLVLKPASGTIVLERRTDSGPTLVLDDSSIQILLNVEYLVRMQVEGSDIRGRIWTGTPDDEPQEWNVSATDAVQSEAGSFGVFGAGYGKISWSMIFDQVVVSTPVPYGFDSRTWAAIKAAGV